MTMHLVGPHLSTTVTHRKQKKSNSNRKAVADAKHNEWLAKQGLTPNQIKLKKAFLGDVKRTIQPDDNIRNTYKLSNSVGNGFKTGIMVNLHREKPEVQKEILAKASRTAPAYSKGAYQYITPGSDPSDLGKKK
jgi:hypothetical protein